jgi:SAM-dependent methyltransferase
MNATPLPRVVHPANTTAHCRVCDRPLTASFVNLGMSPLCESFLLPEQLDRAEPYYPLDVLVCDSCYLVQLKEYVSPADIFSEYAYFSSYSTTWVEHAKAYCEMIAKRLSLDSKSFVVEVASNDGYLLQHFLPMRIPVLGIEPAANVAKAATAIGVTTQVEFFGTPLANSLVAAGKSADLIIGNNVLAQVPDVNDFVAGITRLLKPQGVATLEFPHLARLIADNQFDTIYHEHFSYFSLISLGALASRHGLILFDVEVLPTHGGSLRAYLARDNSGMLPSPSVAKLITQEEALGFRNIETYKSFAPKVRGVKRNLLKFLIDAKEEGKTVCCYGAPGKGNTLLNYCGIGVDFIDFAVDRNPYKHGRFTPGMHIPIYPVETVEVARPDYLFILPWNLRTEIVNQMAHIAAWGGKFLVAIPELVVIDPGKSTSCE